MDSKRHQLIKQLFHRVVELDAKAREELLSAGCGDDHDLRREVEELLQHAAGRGTQDPLDRALASASDSAKPESTPLSAHDSEHGRFLPGTMLGTRYRIVGLLGRGGMGEVYRADDLELGQSVALKFLPESFARSASALERFRREVRVARGVAHPNVCRVYDIGEQGGHVFLSMEFVDGDDLAHVLRRLGRPSPEKAIDIARQICHGVAAAHQSGVLHRDLKPANVMIDGRGRVRITDFGLAGLVDELVASTERAGTPAYMAPEQLAEGAASVRSDIYSLGLLLYELFTGRPAFEGDSLDEILRARSSGSVTSISSVLADVDPAVERVIDRCLQEEPNERPPSAYAVLSALPGGDPLAAALAAGETPSPELVANAAERGGLRPAIALSALAAVVVLSVFIAIANETLTVLPARPASVLSVLAEQKLAGLGITELPEFDAEGFEANGLLCDPESDQFRSRAELEATGWPPPYRFWRRWSKHDIQSEFFHGPEAVLLDRPPRTLPGDASVVLDPRTSNLMELMVVPEQGHSSAAGSRSEYNWSALLVAAGIDPSEAHPSTTNSPGAPAFCTAIRAWDILRPEGVSFRAIAGTCRDQPVYFRLIGVSEPDAPAAGLPRGLELTLIFVFVVMLVPALRNLRLGRGDRRGAFRFALVMVGAYTLIELFSTRNRGLSLLDTLSEVVWLRGAGHIVLHGLQVWVLYMAIEPYMRRALPKMMVGWVRLLSGRVRDPVIGRELLIGAFAGALASAAVHAGGWCDELFGGGVGVPVRDSKSLVMMSGYGRLVIRALYNVSAGMLVLMHLAALWIAVHFLSRRRGLTVGLSVTLLGLGLACWFGDTGGQGTKVANALLLALWLLVYFRVGLLSALAFHVTWLFLGGAIGTDLSAWHSAWTLVSLAAVFVIAGFGCWTALAGQPIFRDGFGEARPTEKAS